MIAGICLGLGLSLVVQLLTRSDLGFRSAAASSLSVDHSYSRWNKILRDFVVSQGPLSLVNYRELKKEEAKFDQFLAQLSSVSLEQFDTFSLNQRLAFLINAYNAFTIKHVLNNYPLRSVHLIGGVYDNPWKIRFFRLLEAQRDLYWLKNSALRDSFDEPRILFALNDAALGSPPLRKEAYTADHLTAQLDEQTQFFLMDALHNQWQPKGQILLLSSIFAPLPGFAEDFTRHGQKLETFLSHYFKGKNKQLAQGLTSGKIKVDYLPFDWNLNEKITNLNQVTHQHSHFSQLQFVPFAVK